MTGVTDHIEVDEFDREYSLSDLFPMALAQDLLTDVDGHCTASIILPEGTVYYGDAKHRNYLSHLNRKNSAPGTHHAFSDDSKRIMLFDLIHELEIIGFLVLESSGEPSDTDERLMSLGRFAVGLINRMINLNYRNRMTAGLHGQVVADTYENLKKKAAALALSEENYRHLAENLEIEVEKKTHEIKAAQLRMLQQEKMASIGQLAAGMAHEINNPVGFVISNLNTLKTTTGDMSTLIGSYRQLTSLMAGNPADDRMPRKIRDQMAVIDQLIEKIDLDFVMDDTGSLIDESLDGAKRVKIIVQNLRDFTHPSIDIAENADLNDCLDTTLAILSSHVLPEVTITRQYGRIPMIACHLREMNQVFFNILINAFQAVGDRGEVVISTATDGDAVMVRISDTGDGIEKIHLKKLFDPFFTTREVGDGTGLGLFQAYSTVKAHGGSITVDSIAGKGSSFEVRLPAARCEQADEKTQTPLPKTLNV